MSVPVNAIKEANEQILLMHSRMQEMEHQIKALNLQLVEKERQCTENNKIPLEIQQTIGKKDAEIQQLRTELRESRKRISNLEQEIIDKDVFMEKLQSKSRILDEVIGFRGSLEGLLSYIKIVEEMDHKHSVSDVNDNLRETEITDGYKSEDEYRGKSSVVLNGHGHSQLQAQHKNDTMIVTEHV